MSFSKGFSKHIIWISTGFNSLRSLTKSAKAHEKSEGHLQSVLYLYNFGKQRIDGGLSSILKVNNSLQNKKVKM